MNIEFAASVFELSGKLTPIIYLQVFYRLINKVAETIKKICCTPRGPTLVHPGIARLGDMAYGDQDMSFDIIALTQGSGLDTLRSIRKDSWKN